VDSSNAWAIIAKDPETISWSSHEGYDDSPNEYYTYDSQVGNYKNVQVGDLVFVKGSEFLIGYGQVESILSEPGKKLLRRCPKCGDSPESRNTKRPKWRCRSSSCNYEFDDDEIVIESVEVVKFRAGYRSTWQDANYPLSRKEVFAFQANRDNQSAIRLIDPQKIEELIYRLTGSVLTQNTDSESLPELIIGGHKIQITKRRIGQQEFRLSLIDKNGENCFVTGSQPACVLEASHIRPFATHESHSLDGGILLRRDIHTLFDRHLLRINPSTWQVETAPQIQKYATYSSIHLMKIKTYNHSAPNPEWLNDHYLAAESTFKS
jgi:hypothetical protein